MVLLNRKKNLERRNRILPFLASAYKRLPKNSLNEQAVPSYLHPLYIMRETFWLRISEAFRQAPKGECVLDYGCGLGAMLPWLMDGYQEIYLFDNYDPAVQELNNLKKTDQFSKIHVLSDAEFMNLESSKFDTIFALDVLEHVENLDVVLTRFKRLLKPDGKLVVSSPTENWIYKFTRKFGSEEFSGEYHLRAAKEVEEDISKHFQLSLKSKIFPIFTYFRIVTAVRSN